MKTLRALLVSALAITLSATAQGQTSSALEETVITASPHEKTADELAGSVNVLDSEALQREVSSTLGDTLKNQLGVHSSSFGPGVGVPVIRGQSGKRVEVLQNNTTIADVSDTSADHAVATEAVLADRIEILRGPATLRYGSGAIGGVVNVIDNRIHTEKTDGVSGAIETRYGDNNDETVVVGRLDAGLGNLGLHLDGVRRDSGNVEIPGFAAHEVDDPDETSNGFIENSDTESTSGSLGLSWVGDSVVVGFSVSQLDNDYGLPPGGHGHEEEGHDEEEEAGHEDEEEEEVFVRIDMEQTQYQGKLLFTDLGDTFNRLEIDLNHTDYEHTEFEIEDGMVFEGTLFDVDSTEIRGELVHNAIGGWLGAFGIQHVARDFVADGDEAFVPPSETTRTGFYLIEEAEFSFGNLALGARIDQQSVSSDIYSDIDHDSFSVSASYLHPISENQRIGLNLSLTERAPVTEELLSDGEHIATATYEIGDPTLDTESAFNAEITWAFNSDGNGPNARASAYVTSFSDYIYEYDTELRFSHDLEDDFGLSGLEACSDDLMFFEDSEEEFEESLECFLYVQEDATFTGIEAELSIPVTEQHTFRVWGDSVRARLEDNGDVPRIPPTRIGASWDYSSDNWSAQLSFTRASDQDRPGDNQEATEGYTRVDAYVGWNLDPISIFLKGTNLTDEEIRNSTSFLREIAPEPGRGFTLGATFRF